jgi:hypothetical protein
MGILQDFANAQEVNEALKKGVQGYDKAEKNETDILSVEEDLNKYHKDYVPLKDITVNQGFTTFPDVILSGNTYLIYNKSASDTAKLSVAVVTASESVNIISGMSKGDVKTVVPTVSGTLKIYSNEENARIVIENTNDIYYKLTNAEKTVDELSEKVKAVNDTKTMGLSEFTENGYISSKTGNFLENTSFASTDFIEIKDNISISGRGISNGNYAIYAFYDEAKNCIPNSAYAPNITEYTEYTASIPENAKYVRFCSSKSNTETQASITWDLSQSIKKLENKVSEIENSVDTQTVFYVGYPNPDDITRFTSVIDCLYAVQNTTGKKVVYINNGTYDLLEEIGGIDYITSKENNGLKWTDNIQPIVDNVTIIGAGNVVLNFLLPDREVTDSQHLFSALNVRGNVHIENITINSCRCRYSIHDESGTQYPKTNHYYKNVVCNHNVNGETIGNYQALGCGFSEHSKVDFENCVLYSGQQTAWTCHAENAVTINFNNVVFKSNTPQSNGLRISQNGQKSIKAFINNCFVTGGLTLRDESSNANIQGDTNVTIINSYVPKVTSGYTVVLQPTIKYDLNAGTETVLVATTS